jgi:hypothetical protein
MLAEDVNNDMAANSLLPEGSRIDQSSLVNALLAAKDQLIEELQNKYKTMEREKDARIAELNQLAEERLHRIAELRRVIDSHNINMSDYPFHMGVAEQNVSPK